MATGSCYTCIKYLMFAFNLLFWLLGLAMVVIGIWVRVDPQFSEYLDNNTDMNPIHVPAYFFIGLGAIILVIGFFGCCGAIRENQCLLGLFFVSLFLIFAAMLAIGIYSIANQEGIKDVIGNHLQGMVDNYENTKETMDHLQEQLQCCGARNGVTDYGVEGAIRCAPDHYQSPCVDALFSKLDDHLLIVAGVAIGVAIIIICGMIFAMVLCCAIRDR